MNSIAKIVIDLPIEGPFDYSVPEENRSNIKVGMRALVQFGRRRMTGFIVGLQEIAEVEKVKPIDKLLDTTPVLDDHDLSFTREMSKLYGCSWGEAIAVFLPPYLRKPSFTNLPIIKKELSPQKGSTSLYIFSDDKAILPVIAERLAKTLREGKSAIVLVPEAGRPRELAKLFKNNSIPALIYHGMTGKKEFEAWSDLRNGSPCVIIGTRSAIFAPVKSLGLIVIFDEDNPAYEQEQPPHYNVFDIAKMRCGADGVDLVLISPAPKAEIWQLAQEQRWDVKIEDLPRNPITMIDMTNYRGKGGYLSFPLQSELNSLLAAKGSALLLMNRRGFAGRTSCNKCGHVMRCPRCDVNLTYIYSDKKLACARCNYAIDMPRFCPQCKTEYLRSTGAGIEKIESELARMYPQARIAVYDRDTEVLQKGVDIIVATQAVLRWRSILKPSLVAVLDLDAELNRFDFRSGQKAFSLLRRLRAMAVDKMYVQTNIPDNDLVKMVLSNDPSVFYPAELSLRKELSLPPFKKMVEIILRGESEIIVLEQGRLLNEKLAEMGDAQIQIFDFNPDVIPKLRDQYRFALVLKGDNMEQLLSTAKRAIKEVKRKRGVLITFKKS